MEHIHRIELDPWYALACSANETKLILSNSNGIVCNAATTYLDHQHKWFDLAGDMPLWNQLDHKLQQYITKLYTPSAVKKYLGQFGIQVPCTKVDQTPARGTFQLPPEAPPSFLDIRLHFHLAVGIVIKDEPVAQDEIPSHLAGPILGSQETGTLQEIISPLHSKFRGYDSQPLPNNGYEREFNEEPSADFMRPVVPEKDGSYFPASYDTVYNPAHANVLDHIQTMNNRMPTSTTCDSHMNLDAMVQPEGMIVESPTQYYVEEYFKGGDDIDIFPTSQPLPQERISTCSELINWDGQSGSN